MINERLIVADYSARRYYWLTIIIGMAMIVGIGIFWSSLPGQVPLFFTFSWGDGRLAPKLLLFLLPGLTFVFASCNIIVGKVLKYYPVILTRIMAIISLVVALMMMPALVGIISSII